MPPTEWETTNGRCRGCGQPLDGHSGWREWPGKALLCPKVLA